MTISGKPPLVIYHAECNDGLTAAWAASKAHPNADFYAAKYTSIPDEVPFELMIGRRLIIFADFSYKRQFMEKLSGIASHVVIFDHHKTALDDLADLEFPGLWKVFDMERSGAGIAWDTLFPTLERPPIVNYVEDYDLWRFALPETRAVVEALRVMPRDFASVEYANDMLTGPFRSMFIAQGEGVLKYKEQMVEYAISFAKEVDFPIPIPPDDPEWEAVLATNVPYFLNSETGNRLAQGRPFGVTFYRDGDVWRVSLRSTKDGMDVAAIAKAYGGGGHKHAAGFECEKLPW